MRGNLTDQKRKFADSNATEFKGSKRKQSFPVNGDDSVGLDAAGDKINVVIENFYPQNLRSTPETELFRDIPVAVNDKNEIILASLIENLKNAGASLLAENCISYYSEEIKVWVNCGREPIAKSITIVRDDLSEDPKLSKHLKIKCIIAANGGGGGSDANPTPARKTSMKEEKKDSKGGKSSKRTKERKISEIVEKVYEWRKLHQGGGPGKSGMSLEDAAVVVGISKKSLDDYLSQIRYGKKYGFDFNSHAEDKVGELRRFVKKERERETQQKTGGDKRVPDMKTEIDN